MESIQNAILGWWRGALHRLLPRRVRAIPVIGDADNGAARSVGDRGGQVLHFRRGRDAGTVDLVAARAAAQRGDGFVWVDLDAPTRSEIDNVAVAFRLPALAVQDAVRAHQRPKLELYDGCLFAVIKPVTYLGSDEVVEVAELALFVGSGFVVTVGHGSTDVPARVRTALDDSNADASATAGTQRGAVPGD